MVVVDRIEGSRAIVEFDGEMIEIPASCLPAGAREGTILGLVEVHAPDVLAEAEARLARLRAAGPSDDEIDL